MLLEPCRSCFSEKRSRGGRHSKPLAMWRAGCPLFSGRCSPFVHLPRHVWPTSRLDGMRRGELDPPSWLHAGALPPKRAQDAHYDDDENWREIMGFFDDGEGESRDSRALDRPGSGSTISCETRGRSARRRARSGRSRRWRSKRAKSHSLSCPFSASSS